MAATTNPLPGIRITWPQAVPASGDAFAQYNVKRRPPGTASWTRIAVLPALATVTYVDYAVASATLFEYTVSWTVNRSGTLYESADATPVVGSVTFPGLFLHDATPGGAAAAGNYVELVGGTMAVAPKQAQTLVPVWGRQAPTLMVGTQQTVTVSVGFVSLDALDTSYWQEVVALLTRQRTQASPLMLRSGVMGDRLFVMLDTQATGRDDSPWEYAPRLSFAELYVLEAV